MTVVNLMEFVQNPIHYFNLANKEEVAIKRGKRIIKLMPEEPDDDPYWDDPRNVEEIKRILSLSEEENPVVAELKTNDDIQNYMRKFLK